MRIPITRKDVKIIPDTKRVISRFFFNGEERAKDVLKKISELPDDLVYDITSALLQEFSKRHRNISKIFFKNAEKLYTLLGMSLDDLEELNPSMKLLIGSYFTHEYSIESAAFFNPSIVEDPIQIDLEEGERRIIISFRAVGEGHISSIVFRRAMIDKNNNIHVLPVGRYVDEAEIIKNNIYNKKLFLEKAAESFLCDDTLKEVQDLLQETFDYRTLKVIIEQLKKTHNNPELEKILWLADAYHEIQFSLDTNVADRVIFPISEFERKGIEDARFVKFINDDGTFKYYATYTAYDGETIMPKLLETTNFSLFKVKPLYGNGARNKNLALFPRKINGKYAMLARIDGWNNYIMYSEKINLWNDPVMIQSPKFYWELVQLGNCGSPIETEEGWLIITHGVGPVRRYCLSASLLDLNNPEIEIGRLKDPILIANQEEREGYVPNVVYSCGAIVNNGELIIPYGLSDYSSSFMSVNLRDLLDKLKAE